MEKPHMVRQTITYSDGTETVYNYRPQDNATEIETTVADATALTSPEDEDSMLVEDEL